MSSRRDESKRKPADKRPEERPEKLSADFSKEFFPENFATDLFGEEATAPSSKTPSPENEDTPDGTVTLTSGAQQNDVPLLDDVSATEEDSEEPPIVVLPDLLDLDDPQPQEVDVLLENRSVPSPPAGPTPDAVAELDRMFRAEVGGETGAEDDVEFEEDHPLDAISVETDIELGEESLVEAETIPGDPSYETAVSAVLGGDEQGVVEDELADDAVIETAPSPRKIARRRAPTSARSVGTGLSAVEEALLEGEHEREGAAWTRGFVMLGAGVGGLLLILFAVGWPYYRLSIGSRAFHHYHQLLRPSGTIGLTLGLVGTGLMVLSLLYLMRKRFIKRETLSNLRAWMGFHVFTGIVGPALILFHAAFVPYSALGMTSFYAMLVVVATGLLGRYIYAHVPRSLEGRELEFEAVQARLEEYRRRLLELGVSSSLLELTPVDPNAPAPHFLKALVRIFYGDRESRQEFKRLRGTVRANRELLVQAHQILPLMRRLSNERQWLVRYGELRKLMGAWRFLHRWLAIVMFVLVIFHIAIGVKFGELWIFG